MTDRCGQFSPYPAYPYQCVRDQSHEGRHGYAGVFWESNTHSSTDGRLDSMIQEAQLAAEPCQDCEVGEPHTCPRLPPQDIGSIARMLAQGAY